jgi:hypothetical protein
MTQRFVYLAVCATLRLLARRRDDLEREAIADRGSRIADRERGARTGSRFAPLPCRLVARPPVTTVDKRRH